MGRFYYRRTDGESSADVYDRVGDFWDSFLSGYYLRERFVPVVDEKALYDALSSGTIFAAGLDVFELEPIGKDHPLASLPNAVLAPHIASASLSTRGGMVDIAADNLTQALQGQTMKNTLTPDVTPRPPRLTFSDS